MEVSKELCVGAMKPASGHVCDQGAPWARYVVILSVTVRNRGSLMVVTLGIPRLVEKWEKRLDESFLLTE